MRSPAIEIYMHHTYQSINNFLDRVMAKTSINGVNPWSTLERKKSKSDMNINVDLHIFFYIKKWPPPSVNGFKAKTHIW